MADTTAPTADDVRDYLGSNAGGPIAMSTLEKALASARERVLDRCMPFPDDKPLPEIVVQAITMFAARLYRRRFSTSGYEGFGDVGIARVASLDPDIEDLLIRYLRYDFA
jgi:hypothetical protein